MAYRIFFTAVLLAAIWLIWSGLFKPLLLALGLLSCVIVLLVGIRMDLFSRELLGFRIFHRLSGYWVWLLGEIVKSNIDVLLAIIDPRHRVRPSTVTVTRVPRRSLGKATLGNSITLTPGTVTLDLVEDRITVHCLTATAAASLARGGMQRRVSELTDG